MGKHKEVWLIDDDEANVFGLKRLMDHVDFCDHLRLYENGLNAIHDLQNIDNGSSEASYPDIIFLDVNMPVFDGWNFIDFISDLNIPEQLKLYVLSASNSNAIRQKALAYPIVDDYLVKPITARLLQQI